MEFSWWEDHSHLSYSVYLSPDEFLKIPIFGLDRGGQDSKLTPHAYSWGPEHVFPAADLNLTQMHLN